MKKFVSLCMMLLLSFLVFADGRFVPVSELPKAAQEFVATVFPDSDAAYANVDGFDIDVRLEDGTEIEFDRKGNWTAVKSRKPLPPSLLPESALDYIAKAYPDTFVNEIERNRRNYEVKLASGWELLFRADGSFVRVADFDD